MEAYRQGLESVIDSLPELAPEIERKTEQIGQVPGIWLQIKEACEDAVVLYFHGGGYIAGSASISEFFAAQFAQRVKIPFLLFDYGLAVYDDDSGEHRFVRFNADGLNIIKAWRQECLDEGITRFEYPRCESSSWHIFFTRSRS